MSTEHPRRGSEEKRKCCRLRGRSGSQDTEHLATDIFNSTLSKRQKESFQASECGNFPLGYFSFLKEQNLPLLRASKRKQLLADLHKITKDKSKSLQMMKHLEDLHEQRTPETWHIKWARRNYENYKWVNEQHSKIRTHSVVEKKSAEERKAWEDEWQLRKRNKNLNKWLTYKGLVFVIHYIAP